MAIKILVDSSADCNLSFIKEKNLEFVPMTITVGEKTFLDSITIQNEEFYSILTSDEIYPKTSQPSPNDFLTPFLKAKENGDSIIAILISEALSGTIQSANIAKEMAEYEKIYIVDTKLASAGIQILVEIAYKMIEEGHHPEEIVEYLNSFKSRIKVFAALDTLKYLYKGGRLSKLQAGLGTLTNIKPIVSFDEEGKLSLIGKAIGNTAGMRKLIELIKKHPIDNRYRVYFIYSLNKDNCEKFVKTLSENESIDFKELVEFGPTIGSHSGPGAYGIIFVEKLP